MSRVVRSSVCLCWWVEVGWSSASFSVMWLWKKKKTLSAPCFPIAHACRHLHVYCRHRNAYGWGVSKFPNHHLATFFFFLSLSPCSTSAHPNHLKICAKSPHRHFVWYLPPPFVWNILTNSSSPPRLSFFSLLPFCLLNFSFSCSSNSAFIVSPVLFLLAV